MKDFLFEKLYRKVDDYFLRNRDWFEQFFILIEKFDRETEEFYYVEVEKLFLETDKEIDGVLQFFNTKAARGDLRDTCHHTSIIYEKFKKNSLRIEDFRLVELKDYFKKVKDRTDDFVNYKKLLLQLKVNQDKLDNVFYYSFPLIGFNKLHGSIHILFNADNRISTEIKISAIFRNTIVIFTEFYEQIYTDNMQGFEKPDYKLLSHDASNNSFLLDLDYPRFYLYKSLNQETKKPEIKSIHHRVDFTVVTELVKKGETFKALEKLEEIAMEMNKELYARVLNMKSRLASLKKEMVNGFISNEDYRNEINKLNYSILMLVIGI